MRGGNRRGGERGMSLVEMCVVMGIITVMLVVAVPRLVGARRNLRAAAGPAEIKAQLRYARQMAMGRQRAVTFQYRADLREINIIQHNADYATPTGTTKVGTAVLNDASYPLTAGHKVLRRVSLLTDGVVASDIAYGLPPGAPAAPLADTTTLSAPVNSRVNITFQPDGSVVDAGGATANFALAFYHPNYADQTARAVSVLGATGRVKLWRYIADDHTFAE